MDVTSFWYIYATNGSNGFLLDIIRRPQAAVARLALYTGDQPPVVLREVRPVGQLVGADDGRSVRLDSLTLEPQGCHGAAGPIRLDIDFRLTGRNVSFVPPWLHRVIPHIPSFRSYYGRLETGTCQSVGYRDLPMVYSTYQVGKLARSKWYLISAFQFRDSDLMFEISASRLLGFWGSSAYVFFEGKEYKFNSVFSSLFRLHTLQAGEFARGQRVFSVSLRSPQISMQIIATAPAERFATLDREGGTTIHTTLFGNCEVRLVRFRDHCEPRQYSLRAERTCLLEVKNET